jgi:hypothetical protein
MHIVRAEAEHKKHHGDLEANTVVTARAMRKAGRLTPISWPKRTGAPSTTWAWTIMAAVGAALSRPS